MMSNLFLNGFRLSILSTPKAKSRAVLLAVAAFALSACSQGSKGQANAPDDNFVIDLPAGEPAANAVQPENAHINALRDKIQKKSLVSVGELTDLVLDQHLSLAKTFGPAVVLAPTPAADKKLFVEKLMGLVSHARTSDPNALKVSYEAAIESEKAGAIQYNSDATSVLNVLRDGKLQCYSGTMLNVLAYKTSLHGKVDSSRIPVVIFETGHVLPGFIFSMNDEGYRLYGVETTASGRGLIDYGPTKDLATSGMKPIRVVGMNDFLVTEALKPITVWNSAAKSALIEVATTKLAKYGVPVAELETKLSVNAQKGLRIAKTEQIAGKEVQLDATDLGGAMGPARELNESPLAFGRANEDGKDRARAAIDIQAPFGATHSVREAIAPASAPARAPVIAAGEMRGPVATTAVPVASDDLLLSKLGKKIHIRTFVVKNRSYFDKSIIETKYLVMYDDTGHSLSFGASYPGGGQFAARENLRDGRVRLDYADSSKVKSIAIGADQAAELPFKESFLTWDQDLTRWLSEYGPLTPKNISAAFSEAFKAFDSVTVLNEEDTIETLHSDWPEDPMGHLRMLGDMFNYHFARRPTPKHKGYSKDVMKYFGEPVTVSSLEDLWGFYEASNELNGLRHPPRRELR